MESVKQMIEELDQPAQQVMIKAVILAVTHESMTSLGIQLSSNPTAFGALEENVLSAFGAVDFFESRGSVTFSADFSVTGLVDLLIKNTDAKILNQPTIWAKDNEEAEFFRGQTVSRIEESKSSAEGGSFTQSFEPVDVGVTLRVRPNITPKKDVNMEINLIISQVEPGLVLGNLVTSETNTTTHLDVGDGETILLSGILFQQDSTIERKLPLLGDIPLLGDLFSHNEIIKANRELLILITPYVVDSDSPESLALSREATEKAQETQEQLNTAVTETEK
jgi:general secretion pathway protein D